MRILVVGAGATGGYFGGRLLEAGRDVTFLVRPRRAEQLERSGLVISSPHGDYHRPSPPTVLPHALGDAYDVVVLACKAYDLDGAIESFAPAVGPATVIVPLLNGMRHLEALERRFGARAVLGGLCFISATLDAEGRIAHLASMQSLSFGERDGSRSARVEAIASELSGARFEARLSDAILQEMWDKWVFIAAVAGITCLMRATIGDIVAAGGTELALRLLDECSAVARRAGFPPGDAASRRNRAVLTARGSGLAASMLRDIERGAPTEADHILGDLLERAGAAGGDASLLAIAYTHLRAYEARRAQGQASAVEASGSPRAP